MKTAEVKELVHEVLGALPQPYSEHVIDDVFYSIEHEPRWLRQYDALCSDLSKWVVNTWIGSWTAHALGKIGKQQVQTKKSKLIGSYSLLDTDTTFSKRKRKEDEARQLMSAYYYAHQAELPSDIASHRELIVALIMDGMSAEGAFDVAGANYASPSGEERMSTRIEIAWPDGVEYIEVDIDNLSEETEIRQTVQHIDETGEDYCYETSSTVHALPDGRFRIEIDYVHEKNQHIAAEDSFWGRTTIILRKSDRAGTVQWRDDNNPQNDGSRPFEIVILTVAKDAEEARYADELEIDRRDDLKLTEKQVMISARRGQGVFRSKVLQLERSCRLTGVDVPAHLRASHIKPWAVSSDNERLDGCNGLMLSPHVDHLFDRAYISFKDTGELLVLNNEVPALLEAWGIKLDSAAASPRPFNSRQCAFLAVHRQIFFGLQGKD